VTNPVITCRSSVTVSANQVVDANLAVEGVNDECGVQSLSISPSSFSCQDVGKTITATVTAIDGDNNQASCQVNVNVIVWFFRL
jgi:hypothetical protein